MPDAMTTVTVRRSDTGRSARLRWYGVGRAGSVERAVRSSLGFETAAVVYGDGSPVVLGGGSGEPAAIDLLDELGNAVDVAAVKDGASLVARAKRVVGGAGKDRSRSLLRSLAREVLEAWRSLSAPDDLTVGGADGADDPSPRGDWNDPKFQQTLLDVERARSHLANERNILAWTRAALTLASQGIVIWKLYASASAHSLIRPYLYATGALVFLTTPFTMLLGLHRWSGTKRALSSQSGAEAMDHFGKLGVEVQAANVAAVLFAAAAAYVVVGADDSVGADFRISSRIFD